MVQRAKNIKESTKENNNIINNNIIYNIYYYNIIYIYINIYNKYNNIYNNIINNNINIYINNNINIYYNLSILCENQEFIDAITAIGYSPNEYISAVLEFGINDGFWQKSILFPRTLSLHWKKFLTKVPAKVHVSDSILLINF